tara:strand:+ start:126 stop:518 length:393 start_codon:yes stop_codon:yes gene_type:complete
MSRESFFLVFVASGVFPISLSYGLFPSQSLVYLYDIEVTNTNLKNIFRAIMGLYISLVTFWIIGARYKSLQLPALWSLTIFMLGLAVGRLLSLVIDGLPYPLFVLYMVLEFLFAAVGYKFIHDLNQRHDL